MQPKTVRQMFIAALSGEDWKQPRCPPVGAHMSTTGGVQQWDMPQSLKGTNYH